MVTYEGVKTIFNFIIITLPSMAIDFLNMCFTPLKNVFPGLQYLFKVSLIANPFGDFIYNNFISPIFEFGIVGLFSGITLFVIIIIKLIDLVIPL